MAQPEQHARQEIDRLLAAAGFAAVVKARAPAQEVLRRDGDATVMKPADFAR